MGNCLKSESMTEGHTERDEEDETGNHRGYGRRLQRENATEEEIEPLLQGNRDEQDVLKEAWYHGHISHRQAQSRCSNRFGAPSPDGAYLVYSVGEDYYLYVCYKKVARRLRVLCSSENDWTLDSEFSTDHFPSLAVLIQRHQKNFIKLKSGKVKLKIPVMKPAPL